MTASLLNKNVMVISDVLGQRGGAYRATALLCQALRALGAKVTCFATFVESESQADFASKSIRIVRPLLRRGYRWDWPNRTLAWQARRHIETVRPNAVIVMGLTRLCGYLLDSSVADQLLVWELTNADPGNKFVDAKAARLLSRCRTVLSPALSIDQHIRTTYRYEGPIERLPFWIEDEGLSYSPPPEEFIADFIFLARREDDKGLRELIQATAMLANEFPKVKVLIGGPGRAEPYAALAAELGVLNNVSFCSLPSREDAMRALSASRCLVLPSYHEGYPLSLLEAAQRSVPFIATTVGSVSEVFAGYAGCQLIPDRDSRLLYDKMNRVLFVPSDHYLMWRRSAHERFRELSSSHSIMGMLAHVFSRMCSRK